VSDSEGGCTGNFGVRLLCQPERISTASEFLELCQNGITCDAFKEIPAKTGTKVFIASTSVEYDPTRIYQTYDGVPVIP